MRLSISSILILMCTAVVANAAVLALDDFSSGDESGGFGWGGAWTYNNGDPIPGKMTFSSADPLNDGISPEYRDDAGYNPYPQAGYLSRDLATPLLPGTTPEVWVGIYLRPETLQTSGWVLGMAAGNSSFGGSDYWQVRAGLISGDDNAYVRLTSVGGSIVGDGTSQFTLGQETMLVLRIYKASPTDTVYNRADLYADLDGTDGRYNNEVAIYTGYSWSTEEIARLEMWQSSYEVDFDYMAVGTTKESVVYPLP